MKDKSTAGILALFLGGLGVHRFYLGQTGLGFFYLIFCWTFIPAGIGVIDALCFFANSKERFDSEYNKEYIVISPKQPASNTADELKKLHELLTAGALTNDEFESEKKKIIAGDIKAKPNQPINDPVETKKPGWSSTEIGIIIACAITVLIIIGVKLNSSDSTQQTITPHKTQDIVGLNAAFTDLKQNGFMKEWTLSNNNQTIELKMIDQDWTVLNKLQQKTLIQGYFNAYCKFINDGLILRAYSQGGILLAEETALGGEPKIIN